LPITTNKPRELSLICGLRGGFVARLAWYRKLFVNVGRSPFRGANIAAIIRISAAK
jgi:hypothetical protein